MRTNDEALACVNSRGAPLTGLPPRVVLAPRTTTGCMHLRPRLSQSAKSLSTILLSVLYRRQNPLYYVLTSCRSP